MAGSNRSRSRKSGPITFRDFAMQWVRGELAAKYSDHVFRERSFSTE